MATTQYSYLDLIKACDNFPYNWDSDVSFYKLYLPQDTNPHGLMLPWVVEKMPWTSDFIVDHGMRIVQLRPSSSDQDFSALCNAAFAKVVNDAIDQDLFLTLHRQHSEPYKVIGAKYPVQIERFATSLFGTTTRGAHLTAYTVTPTGMKIWVPRRSAQLKTYPNRLDTTVAGGIKATDSPFETIIKESDEEASLPEALIKRDARACGVLTYMRMSEENSGIDVGLITPDVVYVYDIELAEDIIPHPQDDEVKEFYLWSVDEVKQALFAGEFKTNSAAIMIDFLVRHGIITAENEPDYVEILMRMHRMLPFPTSEQQNHTLSLEGTIE